MADNQTQLAREIAEEICAYFGDIKLAMGDYVNANGVTAIILRKLNGSEHKAITLREYRADLLRQVREAVEALSDVEHGDALLSQKAVLAAIDKLAETNHPERER